MVNLNNIIPSIKKTSSVSVRTEMHGDDIITYAPAHSVPECQTKELPKPAAIIWEDLADGSLSEFEMSLDPKEPLSSLVKHKLGIDLPEEANLSPILVLKYDSLHEMWYAARWEVFLQIATDEQIAEALSVQRQVASFGSFANA